MPDVSVSKASDLPEALKTAVERLLGRPIAADEEVSIAAVAPQQVPPAGNRQAVARRLEALLNRRAEKLTDVTA